MTILAAPRPRQTKKQEEKSYTFEEYLRKEETAMFKSEFYNGQIIRMPGAKIKHNVIAGNIFSAIKSEIKKANINFLALNSDQKIYIPNQEVAVYPDALVISEKPEFWNGRKDLITNPLLIVEVLSKSTRGYDRGEKFIHYRTIPSFREYVLIEQDKHEVEIWFRSEINTWKITTISDINADVFFNALNIGVPMSDIYENSEDL